MVMMLTVIMDVEMLHLHDASECIDKKEETPYIRLKIWYYA